MQSKIKIKIGYIELEYEGDAAFIEKGLVKLLEEVVSKLPQKIAPQHLGETSSSSNTANALNIEDSTNTIAGHLDVKSGTDLIMAAAAHLTLVKGQAKFTRKEVTDEIKSATTYFNVNHIGNLTKNLNGLTKSKKLNLVATDTFALSPTEKKAIEAKLAQ